MFKYNQRVLFTCLALFKILNGVDMLIEKCFKKEGYIAVLCLKSNLDQCYVKKNYLQNIY